MNGLLLGLRLAKFTSHINYSISYPKPQNKRVLLGYCSHFVSLKPSKNLWRRLTKWPRVDVDYAFDLVSSAGAEPIVWSLVTDTIATGPSVTIAVSLGEYKLPVLCHHMKVWTCVQIFCDMVVMVPWAIGHMQSHVPDGSLNEILQAGYKGEKKARSSWESNPGHWLEPSVPNYDCPANYKPLIPPLCILHR